MYRYRPPPLCLMGARRKQYTRHIVFAVCVRSILYEVYGNLDVLFLFPPSITQKTGKKNDFVRYFGFFSRPATQSTSNRFVIYCIALLLLLRLMERGYVRDGQQ